MVIRVKHSQGVTSVRALMKHPMIGDRETATNQLRPGKPHFIQEVTCSLEDQTILSALWGGDIAKDPFLAFTFKGGNKGETIRLSWVDNWGERDSAEAVIS